MNNLSIQFATRYFWGKKKSSAVPVLSRISIFALAIGSAAMLLLFSVFNGFEGLVKDLYKSFYADLKITPVHGKFFADDSVFYQKISTLNGIQLVAKMMEDNALISNDEAHFVVMLRGVSPAYFKVNNLKPYLSGKDTLIESVLPRAIVGGQIAARLGISEENEFSRIQLHYPNSKMTGSALQLAAAFQSIEVKPEGVFKVQDEFDDKYLFTTLSTAQNLFLEPDKITSYEIKLADPRNAETVQHELQKVIGEKWHVASRYEQNKTLYQIMKTEKWATYAILLMVLLLASANMVGALALLVLEKRKDASILWSMGATKKNIRTIFMTEGGLWAFAGGVIGLLLGTLIALGQQRFGWVKMNSGFIIDEYPVLLKATDFILIICTVIFVGFLASLYPSWKATKEISLRT